MEALGARAMARAARPRAARRQALRRGVAAARAQAAGPEPARGAAEEGPLSSAGRREVLSGSVAAAAAAAGVRPAAAASAPSKWELVDLPIDEGVILLDLAFVPDQPQRGYLLGTRQTLLETNDFGKTWNARGLPLDEDEEINYRLNSISFNGKEGWIVGKPALLLHTKDGGDNWERVPLSSRLPGTPLQITALPEADSAEMITDQGAIYVTSDGAQNWKAAVEETVGATLNRTVSSGINGASYYTGTFSGVARRDDGTYIGISSRGNFYMTWEPGQSYWQPHNRAAARRIQNMGWRSDGGVWLLVRGGGIYYGNSTDIPDEDRDFEEQKVGSRGFGLLDIGFRTKDEAWAAGGSGSLFISTDGGHSWKRDRNVDDLPANLYTVKFVDKDHGFVLGNNSIMLRYLGNSA